MFVDPQLRKICVWNPSFHLMFLSISPEPSAHMLSHLGHVQLFVTPWTVAYQAPLSMELSRQEFWNGLPFLPPGDLPDSGLEPAYPTIPALADNSCVSTTSATWEACQNPGSLSKEICSVAPVDVLLFGYRSCKIDLFPRSLLCCYCLFLSEIWLAGSQTWHKRKSIVPILGRVTQSCPSKTVGLPSPDPAQDHTRVMASLSGGLAICPVHTQPCLWFPPPLEWRKPHQSLISFQCDGAGRWPKILVRSTGLEHKSRS